MKWNVEKKEYALYGKPAGKIEIETDCVHDAAGQLHTVWKIKTRDHLETSFSSGDLQNEGKIKYIFFPSESLFAIRYRGGGHPLLLPIPERIWDALRKEHEENLEKIKQEVRDKEISTWILLANSYMIGDQMDIFPEGWTPAEMEMREDVQKIRKYLSGKAFLHWDRVKHELWEGCRDDEEDIKNFLREKPFLDFSEVLKSAEKIDTVLGLFRWDIPNSAIQEFFQLREAEEEREKVAEEEAKEREEEKRKRIFSQAQDTGKPVLWRKWEEPSGTVFLYAMPDGKTRLLRTHNPQHP